MPLFKCGNCKKTTEDGERPHVCSFCGSWNTFDIDETTTTGTGITFEDEEPTSLVDIVRMKIPRIVTGISPLDEVTGGGFVKGAVYLMSGDSGIGKTTLLLQACDAMAKDRNANLLYATAEENKQQVAMTCDRLNIAKPNLFIFNNSSVEKIIEKAKKLKPKLLIVDSIQVVATEKCSSAIGSTNQIRDSGNALVAFAKTKKITTIIVCHVTKDLDIAGPKTIQHMVDCPMYFEAGDGELHAEHYRILRSSKNRFGSTRVRGLFEMGPSGLMPVKSLDGDKELRAI